MCIYLFICSFNMCTYHFFNLVDDLCEVLDATASVKDQWKELGWVLGLNHADLSEISRDHNSMVQRHYEMTKCWIKNSRASWGKLVDALRSPILKEAEVAKNIAKKYLGRHIVTKEELLSGRYIYIIKLVLYEKNVFFFHYNLIYTEADLSELLKVTSTFRCVSWKVLGLKLGLNEDDLERIEKLHSTSEERMYTMLKDWINTGWANWGELVDTLKSPLLEEDEIAEKITKSYLGMIFFSLLKLYTI